MIERFACLFTELSTYVEHLNRTRLKKLGKHKKSAGIQSRGLASHL